MQLTIPDEVIQSTNMKPGEILQEIAVSLYQREQLSIGQASKLAEMDRIQFQHLLASRGLNILFGIEDLNRDLETLNKIKKNDNN